MATKPLGPATPIQIMRKVIFQLYTFLRRKSLETGPVPRGASGLNPYSHKGLARFTLFLPVGFFDLTKV